jgi:putative tricarboxylic transport membrane protein
VVDAGLIALQNLLSLQVILYMFLGIGFGLVIGFLPGLGGVVGMTLFIPFLFGMDVYAGIAMLIGFIAVMQTSDTFTAILIGVPGGAGSQATVMDGYPLARQGQAARALGASFSASMFGGVIGAVALLVVIGVARPLVQAVGSPELFMLTLLGLATVGVLVRGDPLLGLLAALFGVMLGTIGSAPATPEYRYVFDTLYLYDGLSIAVVALGLFAIPEVISLLVRRTSISDAATLQGGIFQGFRDTIKNWGLVVRSSLIATAMSAIPGMGGAVVDWLTYGAAKQSARDSSQFGKGDIRGVIAPESANNAREGGTLMPTLILGIPGSGTTAVLISALVLLGLTPGPSMLTNDLDVTLTVVWILVIANVLATAICFFAAKPISRVTLIPGEVLMPFLIVVFFAAAWQSSNHIGDLIAVLVVGALGYLMKLVGWPRAAALIGFVLAPNLERYLHLSVSRYGFAWAGEASVLSIGALVALVVLGGPLFRYYQKTTRKR